jgi:hypothetical protein
MAVRCVEAVGDAGGECGFAAAWDAGDGDQQALRGVALGESF